MAATSINFLYMYNITNTIKILSNLRKTLKMATVVCKNCKILYSIYHMKDTTRFTTSSVKWKKILNKQNKYTYE